MTPAAPKPCNLCDAKVREVRVTGIMTPADVRPPIEIKRKCTNPGCRSNAGGSTSVGDVV